MSGAEDERSSAAPAPHELRGDEFLLFRRVAVFGEGIRERRRRVLPSEIGDVAAVAREDVGLRHDGMYTTLIDVSEKNSPAFSGLSRAACRAGIDSFDEWMRESIAIAEVFVRVGEGWNCFEIQGGEDVDSIDLIEVASVLLPASLAFGLIARKENGDGVQSRDWRDRPASDRGDWRR